MKLIYIIKEILIILAGGILATVFFIIWMIAYPIWFVFNEIKELYKKHRNNGK